jgi:hypothetical protein
MNNKAITVFGTYSTANGAKWIGGYSFTNSSVSHQIDDVVFVEGGKQWKVVDVGTSFIDGFYMTTGQRAHFLQLESIEHNDEPNLDDILIKK